LQQFIWPAEGKWVSPEFVELGSTLSMAELLRCGVTCFNDMYFFPDVTGKVAQRLGMRASVGCPMMVFPTPWAASVDECIQKTEATLKTFVNDPLVQVTLSPHAPYTVDDPLLQRVKQLAEKYQCRIHMHVQETQQEVDDHIKNPAYNGKRPIERLQKLGLLSDKFLAIHMTALTQEEVAIVKQTGTHVVTCPESNLKLASGICPVNNLFRAGVNVCIGTGRYHEPRRPLCVCVCVCVMRHN
jgi:5-methylthioadenosine/S-adenosylhomocysteine deaminase